MDKSQKLDEQTAAKANDDAAESPSFPTREDFDQLRHLANQGSIKAQEEIRCLLDEHPQIWQKFGDLALHAELTLIRAITQDEFTMSESLKRQVAQMKRDLVGPNPTPLLSLAVERVVTAWLHMMNVGCQQVPAEGNLQAARFRLQRQAQAQRLYDSAIKSLVLVQRLIPSGLGQSSAGEPGESAAMKADSRKTVGQVA